MRKILLQIHLYGGLITCWYLLVYGWTSLGFNHPWMLPEAKAEAIAWERAVELPRLDNDLVFAETVRDRLGLFGWPHPWSMKRTGSGLWFEMSRPGRSYRITAENGRAVVEERNTGLASALRFLHGSGEGVPNAPWTRTWAVYTEITNWIVLFAIGSGVYLWFSRARRRAAVMLAGGLGVAVSVAMMIAVWWAA